MANASTTTTMSSERIDEVCEIVTLEDPSTQKKYSVKVSPDLAARLKTDMRLAQVILNNCIKAAESKVAQPRTNKPVEPVEQTTLSKCVRDEDIPDNEETVVIDDSQESNEDYEQNDEKEDSVGKFNWSDEATLLFIERYKMLKPKFDSGKHSQTECYDMLSTELRERGYNVNGRKCATKLLSLKRQYKVVLDHNSKSGNDRKTWQYFELMDNIYGKKPWVKPLSTASSTKKKPVAKTTLNIETDATDDDTTDNDDDLHRNPNRRPARVGSKQLKANYIQELVNCKRKATEVKDDYYKAKLARMDQMNLLLAKVADKPNEQ